MPCPHEVFPAPPKKLSFLIAPKGDEIRPFSNWLKLSPFQWAKILKKPTTDAAARNDYFADRRLRDCEIRTTIVPGHRRCKLSRAPWHSYQATYDFVICEKSLCEWIRQPANTWSNLASVDDWTFLLHRSRKEHSETDGYLGVSIAIMGICSFLCHATTTVLFGLLDVTSIFIFLSILSTLVLFRSGIIKGKWFFSVPWGYFL